MATVLLEVGNSGKTLVVQKNGTDVEVLVNGTKILDVQQANIVALTDSTGGTAGDTIANLADGTTYATDHAAIENNFASLAAKVNAILTALKAHGLIASA